MPARIMDPATGASTWALGSHRWVKYIGVFTKKAIIEINHQIYANLGEIIIAHAGRTSLK